jgi:hypothetical protein
MRIAESSFRIQHSAVRNPSAIRVPRSAMPRPAAAALVAACLSTVLAGQPVATLTLVRRAVASLAFSSPLVKKSGTIRPIPGNRLDLVVITVGEMPIESDTRSFSLVAVDGATYEPIAAGGGPDLVFPMESLELGREMGQILPSDAEVLLKRTSTSSVMLEADPGATLAFVFQLPERVMVRALRLPGGAELALGK